MKDILAALMLWIAANSPLAATTELPTVQRMGAVELACTMERVNPCEESELDRTVIWYAFYNLSIRSIVLSEIVDTESLLGESILLHELVHHMQSAAGQHYEIQCQAYQLQDKWLTEHGSSLQAIFNADPFWALTVTLCYE